MRKALRVALAAEWLLIALSVTATAVLEGSLPAPLQAYLKAEAERDLVARDVVFAALALTYVVAALVASVGLFFFRRWARWLYVAATALAHATMLIAWPSVEHPVAVVLGDLTVLVSGLIIGLICFTKVLDAPAA